MVNQEIHSTEQWESLLLDTFGSQEAVKKFRKELAKVFKPDLLDQQPLKQNLGSPS